MVKILADTSVIIELLSESPRGAKLVEAARNFPQDTQHLYSAVTRLELGLGDHHAASKVDSLCAAMRSVALDDVIAKKAGGIVAKFFDKKRRLIPDAVIAASAIQEEAWLWTLNDKDFNRIPGLRHFSLSPPDSIHISQ